MSTFRIPYGFCQDVDALVRRFWWCGIRQSKRFLALKSWDDICQPKALGGLGFRKFKDLNTALLFKLGWKFASGEDKLWTFVMRAKYL